MILEILLVYVYYVILILQQKNHAAFLLNKRKITILNLKKYSDKLEKKP